MSIKTVIRKIAAFFRSLFYSFLYVYHKGKERHKYGRVSQPYEKTLEINPVYILGNGPSLKDDINSIVIQLKDLNTKAFAVNNFAISDSFLDVRPEFYCIADRVYFWENYDEQASSIYNIFNNKVTWDMKLYVPIGKDGFVRERISNNKIDVIPVSTTLFGGFKSLKYRYYKRGMAVPSFVNITIMALFLALNMGCKKIYLYGVDHTFLREIAVDDDNVLCSYDKHFYGDRLRKIQPLEDGTYMRMADFVYDKYLTFIEHDNIRGYADYLGAEIINCTRCSCIDSYTRLTQIKNKK